MVRERWARLAVSVAVLGILIAGPFALGRDTEEQLLQRIKIEQNPVRKAKYEIKLANLKLTQVQDAYSQGNVDSGTKLLATFVEEIKTSWKLLQTSGRKAVKQPEGFRELEISLREDARALRDLGQRMAYFDRDPIEKARQELDRMRFDVMQALFPGGKSQPLDAAPLPPKLESSGTPSEVH